MATTTAVNQNASPAFRGQAAIVTLNGSDTLTKLGGLKIGDQCVISSSSNVGYIAEIDSLGTTFKVVPAQPSGRFDSTTKGILAQGETITITL